MTIEKEQKQSANTLSKFNLLVIIAAIIGFSVYLLEQYKLSQEQELRINLLETQLQLASDSLTQIGETLNVIDENTKEIRAKHLIDKLSKVVDFSNSNIQELDKMFMLTNADQSEHLTGIKFTGRIINTQSVKHLNITFKFLVSDLSKEFVINQISPGNSTSFSVYIPDLRVDKARYAKIEYLNSNVSFYTK